MSTIKIQLVLSCVAFVVATFSVQPLSHFVINADHFASIGFMRQQPIFALGFIAMLMQGAVMGLIYNRLYPNGSLATGVKFSLMMAIFLGAYMALAEPAKYLVPNVFDWIVVEGSAGLLQFTLFGLMLGWIFRKKQSLSV